MTTHIALLLAMTLMRLGGIGACAYLTVHGHWLVGMVCLVVGFSLQQGGDGIDR